MRAILCLVPFLLSGLRLAAEVPSISTPPPSQAVDFGGEVTFTAVAAGTEPLRYEWRHNGTLIAGADAAALTVRNAGSGDSGTYTLTVSNAEGTVTTECYLQAGWADAGAALGNAFRSGDVMLGAGPELSVLNVETGARTPLPLPEALTFADAGARYQGHCAIDRWGRLVVSSYRIGVLLQAQSGVFYPAAGKWVVRTLSSAGLGGPAVYHLHEMVVQSDWIYSSGRVFRISSAEGLLSEFEQVRTAGFSVALNLFRSPEGVQPRLYSFQGPPTAAALACGDLAADGTLANQNTLLPCTDYVYPIGNWVAGAFAPDGQRLLLLKDTGSVHSLAVAESGFASQGSLIGNIPADRQITNLTTLLQGGYLVGSGQRSAPGGPGRVMLLDAEGGYVRDIVDGLPGFAYTAVVPPPPVYQLTASLPRTNPPGTYSALEDERWSLTVPLVHPDPDAVFTLGSLTAPAWVKAQIDGNSLIFSGTPEGTDAGEFTVKADLTALAAATTVEFQLRVLPVNDVPLALDEDQFVERDEDAPEETVDLSLLFEDEETPAASLRYRVLNVEPTGVLDASVTGTSLRLRYLLNQHGTVEVEVEAADPEGASATLTFIRRVRPVNDAPLAAAAAIQTNEDTAANLTLAGNDVDEDALTYAIILPPLHGTLTGVPPSVVYTPQADYAGPDRFEFTVRDGAITSAPAAVEISVTAQPDAPRITGAVPPQSAPAAGDLVVPLAPFVTDPDGEPLTFRVTNPGSAAIVSGASVDAAGVLRIVFTQYSMGGATEVELTVADPTGRSAVLSIPVSLAAPAVPGVRVVQTLKVNRQTGLLELVAEVTNGHTRAIGGFSIAFSGIPAGVCLYNGSQCTEDAPQSVYGRPVQPGETVRLVYQFYSPLRNVNWTPQLTVTVIAPVAGAEGTGGIAVDRCLLLPGGGLLIEFPSEPGKSYQVEIMNAGEAWQAVPMTLVAGGTRVQWIDHGPPVTAPLPAAGKSRFYRVRRLD